MAIVRTDIPITAESCEQMILALVEKFPKGGFLLTGFALGIIMRSSKVSP